jgi:DNA helicase II / ATP-dependent DNA helicase PcrA
LFELKNGFVRRWDGSLGLYDHIMVDELQDFSSAELATVFGAVSTLDHLTLVGDQAQGTSASAAFQGWEKLRFIWKDRLSSVVSLEVSHRSTLPIMRLADALWGTQRTQEGRSGSAPLWYQCRSENRGVHEAIGWLTRIAERYPEELTAVICADRNEAQHVLSLLLPTFPQFVRRGSEANFTFDEGIVVSAVDEVKGLEFSNVLLWNPSQQSYPKSDRSRAALYVAATRAEERLCIVTWGRMSAILSQVPPRLVRIIEEEEEEEDEEND